MENIKKSQIAIYRGAIGPEVIKLAVGAAKKVKGDSFYIEDIKTIDPDIHSELDGRIFEAMAQSYKDYIADLPLWMGRILSVNDTGYIYHSKIKKLDLPALSDSLGLSMEGVSKILCAKAFLMGGARIEFPNQDLTVDIEKGDILIHPPFWTHCYIPSSEYYEQPIIFTEFKVVTE